MADTPALDSISADAPTPAGPQVPDTLKKEWQAFSRGIKKFFWANAMQCRTYQQRRALADQIQYQIQGFFAMAALDTMFDNGGPRFNRVAQQVGIPRNQQNILSFDLSGLENWVDDGTQ